MTDEAPGRARGRRLRGAAHGHVAEDCGPCTQLVVTMALQDGVDAATLSPCSPATKTRMSRGAARGALRAGVLAHDPAADELREEVVRRWGQRGLVSLAYGLVGARLYPTLKYALGHGKACQRVLVVRGSRVSVARLAA